MGEHSRALLTNFEIPSLQMSEEISTWKLFHNDVDVILSLKNIKKSNDMGMLANFEDF